MNSTIKITDRRFRHNLCASMPRIDLTGRAPILLMAEAPDLRTSISLALPRRGIESESFASGAGPYVNKALKTLLMAGRLGIENEFSTYCRRSYESFRHVIHIPIYQIFREITVIYGLLRRSGKLSTLSTFLILLLYKYMEFIALE